MKHDFIEDNIIILSKQTIDMFLKEKNPSELISLYCFYYYTAKWQKTYQPKATVGYCAKGLKIGINKTRKIKQDLVRLGLIEDVQKIDEKTKKIKAWYVKVKYLWKNNHPYDIDEGGNHPNGFPQGGKSHRVENGEANTLVLIDKYSSADNETLAPDGASVRPLSFLDVIKAMESVDPKNKGYYNNTTQREAAKFLADEYGVAEVLHRITFLEKTNKTPYFPTITTPAQLKDKWVQLAGAISRHEEDRKKKTVVII